MGVTNFVHKNCMYFAPKNEIIVKMNRPVVKDGTPTKLKYTYILCNFAFSFTLKS
jgi:hypothetical protein